jgi:cyclophilin family peptidyl-prolyl cis-trans isomerase
VELYPEEAPIAVNNFVFLAKNRFYDGLTFHRVEPGFVAQAGDPTASGNGGPGYWLADETNDLTFDSGTLAMAKAGTSVSGSQFFITLGEQPSLNGNFTVFGRVIEGMDVLQALTPRPLNTTGGAPGDLILSIEIAEADAPAAQGGD